MATQTSQDTERRTRPGKFVWFEHASNDPTRAQAFFEKVIGWKVLPWGDSGYEMILSADTPESMIGGYTKLPSGPSRAHWISYVSVEDVDAAARRVTENGGKVLEEPHELPGVGRAARIRDPQGAELYLFKNASGDPSDPPANEGSPVRTIFWNELHTSEPGKALPFYEAVFGYTHLTMNMGPGDDYHILESKGAVRRAGITGHGGETPHWLSYVAVDDTDAIVARVTGSGGKVHIAPSDIPGIGRFAVIEDPLGAPLAVMKPMPRKP